MATEVERIERSRRSFHKGYLAGFVAFMVLWVTRFFFRGADLNSQPVGLAVLAGLVMTVLVQAYFTFRLARIGRMLEADPGLAAALSNELIRLHETESWKAAFLAAIGSVTFFALLSLVYPICDLVFVALSTIMIGAGAYRAAFLYLDRE